jgi:Transposase DDE domain
MFSAKPSKAVKEAKGLAEFVPVAIRWVIKRSNAWVARCKSLVKILVEYSQYASAKLTLDFIRLMLKQLAAV